ncbi:Protein ECT2 [Acipenser ruthenus]|uniref:Protein ECT2 n=1 Tax=Acipenser ruthenus TaxID=7906 RepID=A0A444UCQ1_ACIRT|nr:Protein ECT2 [Acipenser ruthenus]
MGQEMKKISWYVNWHIMNELIDTERVYVEELQSIIEECQRKLDHKLSLDAYLLKPVQRITKYQLMLKDMLKCSKNSEGTAELEEALASMLDIIKSVNDSMHQIAITGFEGNLNDLGKLLMQGSFSVWTDHKKGHSKVKDLARFKPMQRHLFLYNKMLLFCKKREETVDGHEKTPSYGFKHSLKMSAVGITENVKGDSKKFEVWYNGREEVYIIQASSMDVKNLWVTEIRKVLTGQLEACREASQLHQRITENVYHATMNSPNARNMRKSSCKQESNKSESSSPETVNKRSSPASPNTRQKRTDASASHNIERSALAKKRFTLQGLSNRRPHSKDPPSKETEVTRRFSLASSISSSATRRTKGAIAPNLKAKRHEIKSDPTPLGYEDTLRDAVPAESKRSSTISTNSAVTRSTSQTGWTNRQIPSLDTCEDFEVIPSSPEEVSNSSETEEEPNNKNDRGLFRVQVTNDAKTSEELSMESGDLVQFLEEGENGQWYIGLTIQFSYDELYTLRVMLLYSFVCLFKQSLKSCSYSSKMADSSTLTLGTGRSLDLSAFDSRLAETSKEHLFLGSTSQDIEDGMPQVETRVVLVGEAGNDDKLLKALEAVKVMEVPVVRIKGGEPGSESGNTFIKTIVNMEIKVPCIKTCNVKEFGDGENTIFILTDFECPEYGYLYKKDNRILGPPVVLHCAAKEEVKLVNLAHYMGGTIRRDFSSKVTHLIANSTHGEKFRVAVSMGTPILKTEWIYKAWEKRNEPNFCAAAEEFRLEFKVPPFQDCVLSFLGFSDEDKASMEDMTEMQGGRYLDVGDVRCTHMVVEENTIKELPFEPSKKLYVVKQEAGSPTLKKSVSLLSLNTPNSNRKRRRLQDTLAQLTRETDISPFPPHKRTSAEHSLSMGSLLDISNTPESGKATGETPRSVARPSKSSTPVPQKQSARWQVAKELYQTENNYVDILTTVLQLFKDPLEKEGQLGGPILAVEEIKTIFGSIPDIFDVHTRIKNCVCVCMSVCIYIYIYIHIYKSECGRQTLAELLIRPVQRLPSVALLLNDIRKHTADDNPDKVTLEKAIESLKEVMTHINEDKRKTEGQKQIFDVVYEVDNCPANLLSSHRSLVHRVETISLGDKPCDRGENVTLFLFNDCLEIARKRHKVISTFRSPHGGTRPQASLKHITLMPLSQIRKVLDLKETEDCHNAFALVVRPPTEQDNLLFSFQLTAEDTFKEDWLRMLCRHVANTICKADAENLIQCTDPDSLQVNTKDMDSSTLSRASRAIKKTSKKILTQTANNVQ